MSQAFEPRILAFLCNWCSYAGADLAGVSRFQYPPTIRVLRTMCSGRVDPIYLTEGLKSGFDGVFIFGCHIGDCHYLEGNVYAEKRMQMVENLFDLSGIGRSRVRLRWVSAAEGQLFADYISELSGEITELGPFDPSKFALELPAVEAVFNSARFRWLTGMERQITERGNVYNKKIDESEYAQLVKSISETEYQKALILETLRTGPQSVREIAARSGLPVQTVSQRLTDVEKAGQAELHGYEGTTPKFARLAA
ncbi:MAG: hydrogenase iron-sulfur subunit [Syntrophobacter sp.]